VIPLSSLAATVLDEVEGIESPHDNPAFAGRAEDPIALHSRGASVETKAEGKTRRSSDCESVLPGQAGQNIKGHNRYR
jgi:hypothetical protein